MMRLRSPKALLLSAAAALPLLFGAPARADEPLVSCWRTDVNNWVFAPAYAPDGSSVLGFLAWAAPGISIGDNISVLWYERGQNDDWTVWAWKTNDFVSAVNYARASVSNPALWGADQDIADKIAASPPPAEGQPTEVYKGLFIDDPNAPTFLNSPDPSASVDAAAEGGYPAAPTMSSVAAQDGEDPNGTGCVTSDELNTRIVLNRITYESELGLFGESSLVGTQVLDICCWCPCYTTEVNTGWICIGAYLLNNTQVFCMYQKGKEITRHCAGEFILSCNVCNGATVVYSNLVYGEAVVAPGTPCPTYTGAAAPPATYPTRPEWWP